MNDETSTNTGWWRWPLVPLASILAAALGAIAVVAVGDVIIGFNDGYSKTGWVHIYIYPLFPCAAMGYMLAGTAFHVAPRAKLKAAVAMTSIMACVLLALAAFCWAANVPINDAVQVTVGTAAALAGAVFALRLVSRERRETGSIV